MSARPWRRLASVVAVVTGLGLGAGCTTNPATGEQDFTPFMSTAQEAAIGREQHPKLLAAFGGAYDERPALERYVERIGRRLQSVSEMPEPAFTFTIVNSDDVNAFALPGGYVYVTRGLIALANSEAELAGVLAHEIGHVTARHAAQRYHQSLLAQLGAVLLGAATGNRLIGDLARVGATAYVQKYSREQELEADRLGVRYLERAGYDPRAMTSFLRAMKAEHELARTLAGRTGRDPTASLFSSHPRTIERVAEAAEAARGAGAGGRVGREAYLRRLDGTLFGDDSEQGLRRGRVFAHPKLGFRFVVPPGFRMHNTQRAVIAWHRNGSIVRFDADRVAPRVAMVDYLAHRWLDGVGLRRVERINVNGLAAATGVAQARTRSGPRDVRGVAIRFDGDRVYRFLIVTPARLTDALNVALRRMTHSFRPLTPREAAALKPLRVRVHEVERGETVESLGARLPYQDLRVERFRVLNGLHPGAAVVPGQLVKLIAE